MSAHESMEQADHAKEAAGENRKIALLIAVIALCLALSETLGKGAQTESIAKNVEASNLWAFFQAKTVRRTVVQTAAEQSGLGLGALSDDAARAAAQKQIEQWQKTAARYRSEPDTGEGTEQLSERAKHAEEERELATAKYHHFELASAAFQIAIVLASATIITGILALAWISGALMLAGIAITALGILVPHLLHLHELLAQVGKIERALAHPLGDAGGLLGVDGRRRLLHQGDDVAHAEDAIGDARGMEILERVDPLADADQLDRLAGHRAHGQRGAAAAVAVDAGEHDAG